MASRTIFSYIKGAAIAAGLMFTAGAAFLYSGLYPMGADDRHTPLIYWALETLRDRSIVRASTGIEVPPNLEVPERLLAGGADYNDMCAGCHLKPGKMENDLTLGLYPVPPNLTQLIRDNESTVEQSQRHFWIIKHGIKASGMPAWGPGHDDDRIWSMVAFLQRLPDLSPYQYQVLTTRGENDAGHH